MALGVGGIPRGRLSIVWGPESSGKTSLCLSITKNAIEKNIKVLYVDPENGVDHNYIRAIVGDVDSSKLVLIQPETAEQTLDICEKGINSTVKNKENKDADPVSEFGLIVLDSVGALAPQKEKEDDFAKAHISLVPRLLSAFLRRNAFAIRKNNTALLLINQVRANISGYGNSFEMPGGHAIRHYSSIIISLYKSTKIEKGPDNVVGAYSRFTITKNKLAIPFRTSTFPLIYGIGIDFERDLVDLAELLGVIQRRGSYYVFKDKVLAQGLQKTVEYLKNDREAVNEIISLVHSSVMDKRVNQDNIGTEDEEET
jgi:recombination protein RecA